MRRRFILPFLQVPDEMKLISLEQPVFVNQINVKSKNLDRKILLTRLSETLLTQDVVRSMEHVHVQQNLHNIVRNLWINEEVITTNGKINMYFKRNKISHQNVRYLLYSMLYWFYSKACYDDM